MDLLFWKSFQTQCKFIHSYFTYTYDFVFVFRSGNIPVSKMDVYIPGRGVSITIVFKLHSPNICVMLMDSVAMTFSRCHQL